MPRRAFTPARLSFVVMIVLLVWRILGRLFGTSCGDVANRRVRTCMSGGVGRVAGNGGPYPMLCQRLTSSHDKKRSSGKCEKRARTWLWNGRNPGDILNFSSG
ncbi:hypothetical protein Fuma_01764 [Fuerstiella marisgermanici]|uniref:Uncharacterized protein n=1 Tax=Fuerstiella marisgermanici TaxID=1891926 RepID=A0A1P8WDL3_9PLAN|nr:hypothetical protein Fuma_01764 [Fuerstiella marisgermanici]